MPEAGLSQQPSLDSSSEAIPTVGYAHVPLPSVDNSVMPELVWMALVPGPAVWVVDREVAIPRWRLAWEGPLLEERSAESIRWLGPGSAFRNTSYRVEPAGEYRLLLNHPRFVEWIGVPQSGGWGGGGTRAQWTTAGRQTLARSGCCGSSASATRCRTYANQCRRP